jgi:hypothetical protein
MRFYELYSNISVLTIFKSEVEERSDEPIHQLSAELTSKPYGELAVASADLASVSSPPVGGLARICNP